MEVFLQTNKNKILSFLLPKEDSHTHLIKFSSNVSHDIPI